MRIPKDQLIPQAAPTYPKSAVRGEYGPQTLFNVARGFSRRVPLTRLLEVEPDMRPYLASIIVRAVQKAGDSLVIPASLNVQRVSDDEFECNQLHLAARTYNMYGALE